MLRKAAIVLALAASFLGAQAMDLPKPSGRELHTKNTTKTTKANRGAKGKAKTVEICLFRDNLDFITTIPGSVPPTDPFLAIVGASVYNCDDITGTGANTALVNPAPTRIGVAALSCTGRPAQDALALCQTEVTLNTEWHKTDTLSSLVGTFWTDVDEFPALSMVAPVVTGATGAWGKLANIRTVSLTEIDNNGVFYRLTISYKGRGWNPSA